MIKFLENVSTYLFSMWVKGKEYILDVVVRKKGNVYIMTFRLCSFDSRPFSVDCGTGFMIGELNRENVEIAVNEFFSQQKFKDKLDKQIALMEKVKQQIK